MGKELVAGKWQSVAAATEGQAMLMLPVNPLSPARLIKARRCAHSDWRLLRRMSTIKPDSDLPAANAWRANPRK